MASMLPFLLLLLLLLLSVPFFSLIVADLDSDKQSLLDFISSVPHARKLNWEVSLPICGTWIGVTCNPSNTRVVSIRLPAIGLYGPIPTSTLGKIDSLRILSLRSNHLNGTLPSDVTSIPSLQFLYLQHNNFTGGIPISFSPQLKVLDLSFNSFSGSIPPILQNLTRLKHLNLSYNHLVGSIPYSLRNFPETSFLGNSFDHSKQPLFSPQNHRISSGRGIRTGTIVAIVIGGSTVLFLTFFFIVMFCLKKKGGSGVISKTKKVINIGGNEITSKDFGSGVQEPEKNKLFFFGGSNYNFDLEDLLRASAEVLGKGSYGAAYKAVLDGGTTLVVKRLREVIAGKREFEQKMELVAKAARHPNVVPILAYYYSKDEKLLVFEYMPEGSLFARLHGSKISAGSTTLNWDSRVKVAHGAAKAIAYLHSEAGGHSLHGDIKSTNVFLTGDHDGCVSDIGLTPLMNLAAAISRTIGYHPPEVIETRKVTHKSDVYSFGVLLLEMLTGKAPLQYPGHENSVDLPRWVRSVVREEWTSEVFDVELLREQSNNVEEEMVQMLQIALLCVSKVPEGRPNMDQVLRMVEEIREGDSKERRSSEAESNLQTP